MPLPDLGLTALDYLALALFVLAWVGFAAVTDLSPLRHRTLTARMNRARRDWMHQMLARPMRMVDTAILANLLNGTAFFASTSILAIGGGVALLGATERVIDVARDVPFLQANSNPVAWETKIILFTLIFVYAFFKFGWAYRLFNYSSILVGAVPPPEEADSAEAQAAAERAAEMNIIAGKQFNRGLRAFFFALGYLGWFIGPEVLIATTTLVVAVLTRRQFGSNARRIVDRLAPG